MNSSPSPRPALSDPAGNTTDLEDIIRVRIQRLPGLPYVPLLLECVKVYYETRGHPFVTKSNERLMNMKFVRQLRDEILTPLFFEPFRHPYNFFEVASIQEWLFGSSLSSFSFILIVRE